MKRRVFCLLAMVCAAPVGAGEKKVDPEVLYRKAWYVEEGLRDPAKAVTLYTEVAEKFSGRKAIAAKALTRAAGCYKKLGRVDMEREVWVEAWKHYKEEIEKSPRYQHESIRIISRIEKELAVSSTDVAKLFGDILGQMQAVHIIPVRDRMLEQAQKQRAHDLVGALRSLRFAILLSIKLGDEATAAAAQSKIGEIWFEHEAFSDAIKAYDEVRKDYPNQRRILAWNQMKMAEAFRLIDMPLHAIDYYGELLKDYSDQKEQVSWGKLWMGDCYRGLGNIESAKKTWKEMLRTDEAKEHPRQQMLARILLGLEAPPETLEAPANDEFANDEAYFIAVRHEMDGNTEAARKFLKLTIDLSAGKDWPHVLASHYLTSAGLDRTGE